MDVESTALFNMYCKTSPTDEKMAGADRKPNERARSTKYLPFQRIPSKCLSSTCTGILWYAFFMSNFPISAPLPAKTTRSMAASKP